jgi:hypothetical protein
MIDFFQTLHKLDIIIIGILLLISFGFHLFYFFADFEGIPVILSVKWGLTKFLFSIIGTILGTISLLLLIIINNYTFNLNSPTVLVIWFTFYVLLSLISIISEFKYTIFIFNITPNIKRILNDYINYYENNKNIENEFKKNYNKFKQNIKL